MVLKEHHYAVSLPKNVHGRRWHPPWLQTRVLDYTAFTLLLMWLEGILTCRFQCHLSIIKARKNLYPSFLRLFRYNWMHAYTFNVISVLCVTSNIQCNTLYYGIWYGEAGWQQRRRQTTTCVSAKKIKKSEMVLKTSRRMKYKFVSLKFLQITEAKWSANCITKNEDRDLIEIVIPSMIYQLSS